MPKASKSSASSGTRKKHAKKAAGTHEVAYPTSQNAKTKPSKKEIKKGLAPLPKKSFIPPSKSKPGPPQTDPLDNIKSPLPPELLVVLKRLGKKDAVTKSRALEELEAWIRRAKEESSELGNDFGKLDELVIMLPVWLHRFPALCLHQSRRIRHITVSIHSLLLEIPLVRTNITLFLRETGSEDQVTHILGSWCLSAWDVDRGVAARGSRSWNDVINTKLLTTEYQDDTRFVLDDFTLAQSILPFIIMTVMDPSTTYMTLNPTSSSAIGDSPASSHLGTPRRGTPTPRVPPASVPRKVVSGEESSSLPTRVEDELESVDDRNARLRVGAMGALRWVLDTHTPTATFVNTLRSLLSSPKFWTVLHHADCPPFLHKNPLQWEHGEAGEPSVSTSDVMEGFGARQTTVRRAGWGIVHSLMGGPRLSERGDRWRAWFGQTDHQGHSSASHSALGLISSAVLRSAFTEPDSVVRSSMWEPLLVFLTKVNKAWLLNLEYENSLSFGKSLPEDDSDDDSESSASVEEIETAHQTDSGIEPAAPGSAAYAEFLTFLSLGCNGSATQGYPTVLVIFSTIPTEILSPTVPALSGFFDALWSAIDGQALDALAKERARNTEAFLSAWGECLVWIAGKLVKSLEGSGNLPIGYSSEPRLDISVDVSPTENSCTLVRTQFQRLVAELDNDLRVDASVSGVKVAGVLEKLENVERVLLDGSWMEISSHVGAIIINSDDESRKWYTLSFLATFYQHLSSDGLKSRVEHLVSSVSGEVVRRCQDPTRYNKALQDQDATIGDTKDQELLVKDGRVIEVLLERFGDVLEREQDFIQILDDFFTTKLSSLLSQPSLVLCYLNNRTDATRRLAIWHLFLSTLGSPLMDNMDMKVHILGTIFDASRQHSLITWAKPQGVELQELTRQVLAQALDGEFASSSLVVKLLQEPEPFIDEATARSMILSIVTTVKIHAQLPIRDESAPLKTLSYSLSLLLPLERNISADNLKKAILMDILPGVFILAFVMPSCFVSEDETMVASLAKQFWESWRDHADKEAYQIATREIKQLLKGMIVDTDIRPRPVAILNAFSHIDSKISSRPLLEIIPTQLEFNILLSSTSADPIDFSLAIIEPLVPSTTRRSTGRSLWNTKFDSSGFSPYARGVSALINVLTTDRHVARENMWALEHALTLALFASEVLRVPRADSPVFGSGHQGVKAELREITRFAQQAAAFLLTSTEEGSWHKDVVDALSGNELLASLDSTGKFIRLVFEQSKLHDTVRDSLVLHTVLQHILRNATKEDADLWMDLSRSIDKQRLQTSLAISLAVTEFAPEPPKLDRYRNELASKLIGIPSSKANTTGLRLLRCLSAVAPNPESEVIFLPQQRAVYLVQTLQAWMGSDEDLDECVESEISLMLFNVAPILQNVQGSHWEFIMDLIESNMENCSFEDANSLVILSRTLRLLTTVQGLASSNKYLRELWNQHFKSILVLVRDLLKIKIDQISPSVPLTMVREQALSIVQELPESLMDENTLSTMCHLLTDPAVDNQKMGYQVLQQAARRRTDHLVVEAGVDSENTVVIDLPREVVSLLQNSIKFDESDTGGQDPLAYLLGWMITFDLFTDSSLKVKTAYVDQLRLLDLIGGYFLPNIFEILGVGGSESPFKLDHWAVDEYWLQLYDIEAPQSLRLLAAHIYYRALVTVPSLIRTWWEGLKDRQLSAAVISFTSSYFSPKLVASELIHVKPPRAADTSTEEALSDETFNVKVALAINQVTATFNVDDQQMEIAVKLPTGYPLKTVDVRPIRRVGVPEKVWRRWLFAVQQVVTSHNGRIVDGLALFKKTASLHFEGQVECAICYSILHVADRSLPTKPCKTCKNRFHAGCLYKWFNTSHSSSCPLCRSDIM